MSEKQMQKMVLLLKKLNDQEPCGRCALSHFYFLFGI